MIKKTCHYPFNFTFCTILLLFMFLASSVSATQNPWDLKLPFKSAVIKYKITGMENGTQTTYIKDYGRYRATYRDTSMTIMGFTQHTKTAEITTPDWIYSINFTEGTGTKSVNPTKYMKEEFERLSSSDKKKLIRNSEKLGYSISNNAGADIKKHATKFLGYDCDVMNLGGMKSWVISGTDIVLKSEADMMGAHNVTVATEIKETSVPDDKFQPPAGISLEYDKQSEEHARRSARETIKMLLEGKMQVTPPSNMPGVPGNIPVQGVEQNSAPAPGNNQAPPADFNEMMKQLKALTGQ